jgi:hypothetical protein
MSRIRTAVRTLAACGLVAALAAVPASAKTTTLHFFSKDVYIRLSDSSGKALPSNSTPTAGDRLSIGSDDYVGDHKHHAKRATASDHVVCTVQANGTGLCDGSIALGGAVIIGDDFVLNFASNGPTVVKITGGTGRYRHAHGTVVAKSVSNSATDLTIKVTT